MSAQLEETAIVQKQESCSIGFTSSASFELIQRVGTMFTKSSLVPKEFQGNLPNCIIAVNMAGRLGADPLLVMQNLYVVHGRPGWSAKFKIAMFNQTGKFTPISYQTIGEKGKDTYGIRAVCVNKETSEPVIGPDITIGLAKAEGWYGKQGSKWQTIPDLMLRYRAAAWMIDTTAPELTMGLKTTDELEEMAQAENITEISEVVERKINMPPAYSGPLTDIKEEPKAEASKPQDKPQPAEETKPKQSAAAKKSHTTASKPLENPNFAEGSDPNPFTDSDPNFGS
jgi:hypothetical protein